MTTPTNLTSEFDLISRHFTRPAANAVLGVGDDCALVDVTNGMDLTVSTDTMVSGTHFFPDVDPEHLGHKALAVNLSDIAAMGAMPYWAMLALTVPNVDHAWLAAFAKGFFDLAAELESELEEESEEVSLSEEEQSLEEIFKEFKKGVEQQLDSEDYDTHYNLGIAYKEMGLIDEAIGEFQLASKDPMRAVECASMLGLCFLEKGMPQLAIKWYRKGLEMPEILAEENVGLLYDLGSAYVEVGDTENAQKAFEEVYSLSPNYRDIVTRIKQLEDARR
jgi:tetratricopeptide (TPR) repeat protein